jgi:hypothetical protein
MHNRVIDLDATQEPLPRSPSPLTGRAILLSSTFSDVETVAYVILRKTVGAWIFATALPIADSATRNCSQGKMCHGRLQLRRSRIGTVGHVAGIGAARSSVGTGDTDVRAKVLNSTEDAQTKA